MPDASPPNHSNLHRHARAIAIAAMLGASIVVISGERMRSSQAAVVRADPDTILGIPRLRAIAIRNGKPVYMQYCSGCHGADGHADQQRGIPDLNDNDFLYGSGVADIEDIARHGIRSHDSRGANLASMPAYAQAIPYKREPLPSLTPTQIEDLTQDLLWFTGRQTDTDAARRGRRLFQGFAGCWDCHAGDAGGDPAIGAPALSDATWLYGGSHDLISRSIAYGRAGISPAFNHILTAAQLRDVAVYVAALAPAKAATK